MPRFEPGKSGNPAGRPKNTGFNHLAYLARQATNSGQELVDFFVEIFRNPKSKTSDRIRAAEWLSDRAYGKATQPTELSGSLAVDKPAVDLSKLSDAELAELQRLVNKTALPVAPVLTEQSEPTQVVA